MLLLMRALLVVFASASGYLIILQLTGNKAMANTGIVSGLLIAAAAMLFEERVKKTPLRIVVGGAVGLVTGLVVANLLTYPFVVNFLRDSLYLQLLSYLLANCVVGYIGLSIGMKKGDELKNHFSKTPEADSASPVRPTPAAGASAPLLVDTSVIIDGRVAEVAGAGFIHGLLIVPHFVLGELQHIADSSDPVKRVRGRRGLDILKQIQGSETVEVAITDHDVPSIKEVDAKLVALAKKLEAKVLTNDANLNKIAELQGVPVLNINRLATALKPVVMPGETLTILVLKEGKEHAQGVGYLDDGTMVVIDKGRDFVGRSVDVSITSVLQTTGGR
ncbi:MAG: PIN/TRAM domain-containing protein, partial [Thermodesulfobacteriota bacterium]